MSRFGRSYIKPITRITPKPSPIRQYTANPADSAPAADTQARVYVAPRAVPDTASGTDAVTRSTRATRTPGDNAAATDALTMAKTYVRLISDTSAATDALVRAFIGTRAIPDSVGGTESVARAFIGTRLRSDSAPATDGVTRSPIFARTFADSAPAVDSIVRQFIGTRLPSDSSPAVDSVARQFIGTRTLSNYASIILADSPVSYWHLNETTGNMIDVVSAFNGVPTGTAFVRGVAPLITGGDGAWQNSTSAFINVGDHLDFPSGAAFSVECWATHPGVLDGASRGIISKVGVDGSGQQGWLMNVTSGGTALDFRMYRDNQLTRCQGGAMSTSSPNHCVVTFDGTNLCTYLNGALVAGPIVYANAAGSLLDNAFNMNIGAWTNANNWGGKIDEAAVYNYALAPAQILRHYNVGVNGGDILSPTADTAARTSIYTRAPVDYSSTILSTPNLLSYWRLDEASGSFKDNTGLTSVSIGSGITRSATGALTMDADTAITFDGSAGSTATLPSLGTLSDFSLEVWFFDTQGGAGSTNTYILNRGQISGDGAFRLISRRAGNGYYAGITTAGAGAEVALQPTTAENANQWVHWVMTRSGSLFTVYRNGAQVGQTNSLGAGTVGTSGLTLGVATQTFGSMDELAVYSRGLTASEVLDHYRAGVKSGILSTNYGDRSPSIDGSTRQFIGTRAPVDYRSTILNTPNVSSYYRLGESSGSFIDVVGARNGTSSGALTRGTAGLITSDSDTSVQIANVAGQSNYIGINYDTTLHGLASNFSVEFWAVADATLATGTNGLLKNESGSGATGTGFTIYSSGTAGSFIAQVNFQWFRAAGAGATFFSSQFAFDWSSPHHIALTYNGTNALVYLDGALSRTFATSYTPNDGTSGQVTIGRYSTSQTWPGRMDELAWYSRVLSAAEVTDHYRAGIKSGALTTNYGDRVTPSETVVRQFTGSRSGADLSPLSDTLARQAITTRASTEASAGADTNIRQFRGARTPSDASSGTDALTRRFVGTRLFTDPSSGTEAVVRSVRNTRANTDTAAATDALVRAFIGSRSISDSAPFADAVARHFVGTRVRSDNAPVVDTLVRSTLASRSLTDTTSGTDSVARFTIVFRRIFEDFAQAVEGVARRFVGGRVITDETSISDEASFELKRYPISVMLGSRTEQRNLSLIENNELVGTLVVNDSRVDVLKSRPANSVTEVMTREFFLVNQQALLREHKQVNLISGSSAE